MSVNPPLRPPKVLRPKVTICTAMAIASHHLLRVPRPIAPWGRRYPNPESLTVAYEPLVTVAGPSEDFSRHDESWWTDRQWLEMRAGQGSLVYRVGFWDATYPAASIRGAPASQFAVLVDAMDGAVREVQTWAPMGKVVLPPAPTVPLSWDVQLPRATVMMGEDAVTTGPVVIRPAGRRRADNRPMPLTLRLGRLIVPAAYDPVKSLLYTQRRGIATLGRPDPNLAKVLRSLFRISGVGEEGSALD
jgi:hypothetical protein